MKHSRILVAACLSALLAACGGGGDASPPASAGMEKYLGTWTTCQAPPEGVISVKVSFTLTRASDATAAIVQSHDNYEFTNTCSGTPVRTLPSKGTVTFAGSTQIGEDSAEKVDIFLDLPPPSTSKWVYAIRPDGKLYGGISKGLPGASFDAQGYPSALGLKDWVFTRQ